MKHVDYFAADFETTVYKGQDSTYVWAAAIVPLYTEDVEIFHSLPDFFNYLISLKKDICVYFHNVKFDGTFWLDYLLRRQDFQQAVEKIGEKEDDIRFLADRYMPPYSFKYIISDMGQWYSITIRLKKNYITIRDSLKLLPFSVEKIGKDFKTKHKKLSMKYEGFRYPGCDITDEEKEYIANDVLVIKEALEIMFDDGHKKMTIGSCCLSEFKSIFNWDTWNAYDVYFPNLAEIPIDESLYGTDTAYKYIRRGYHGGWCYIVPEKASKIYNHGTTCDVNSLYPSVMHSESGNYYPVGRPTFWHGDYIPPECKTNYYYITIKTRFYLKENYLPCIQIKGNFLYPPREWLSTSDIIDKNGNRHRSYKDLSGNMQDARVTLTLTKTDFELIKEHYILSDFEILHGCYFKQEIGLFDGYINKWREIKMNNEGAIREMAKLFLNNLYGKLSMNQDSSFKYAYLKDNHLAFISISANEKTPGYIAIGAAITSYARAFTIKAAQQNFHGADKPGFIYADTDSIHCDLNADEILGAPRHDTAFCHWKYEATWDIGFFVRPKTYIERVVEKNLKACEPFYNIKCAGMPEQCKSLFLKSIGVDIKPEEIEDIDEQEVEDFLKTKRTLTDFKIGLIIPGKLMPKHIPGGTLLVSSTFEMR